jgi:23S rRNA (guanosine2251-2'-O)-methyltransferase
MLVILHNIRSLHNVGSIFRTADGAGVKKLYLCGITPIPVDKFGTKKTQLSKVSLGAEEHIEWEYKKSTVKLIKTLKSKGYKIIALEQNTRSIPFDQVRIKPHEKAVLILGTEVTGLEEKILNLSDQIIEIPMYGQKESLNVSVAFGIAIYKLLY